MTNQEFTLIEKMFGMISLVVGNEIWQGHMGLTKSNDWKKRLNEVKGLLEQVKEERAPFEITAGMVKELREQTGEGLMACKNVLINCKGDMVKAKEYLR